MSKNQDTPAGYATLTQILADAVANGAEAVTLERDSGGSLDVCFMAGNSGVGFALSRDAGDELLHSMWEEKRKGHGKFHITLLGKDYMIHVKTYDHFGENAYRLTVREARRKRPSPSKVRKNGHRRRQ